MRASPAALAAGLFVFLAVALPARAQLATIETDDLRLVYPDPSLTYLAPYVARCFESSLRFHKGLFQFEPWEPITVTLTDLSDIGRANAGALPRNNVNINVAPVAFAPASKQPITRSLSSVRYCGCNARTSNLPTVRSGMTGLS